MDQSNICLVYQGGALKCVPRALVPEVALGDAPEFVVDKGDERIEGFTVAAPPTTQ